MSTQTIQPQAQAPRKTVVHPLVDIFENDNEFLLVADLPGVEKDALKITANNGTLQVEAETDTLDYRRSFALGDDIDLDAIAAKLEFGELAIHLPKRSEARVRKITVQA